MQVIDMVHLLVTQLSVDIFLVDWERPHAVSPSAGSGGGGGGGGEPTKELAVSVWRTYLVANEWNELQTRRKTSLAVQILTVIFILKVSNSASCSLWGKVTRTTFLRLLNIFFDRFVEWRTLLRPTPSPPSPWTTGSTTASSASSAGLLSDAASTWPWPSHRLDRTGVKN